MIVICALGQARTAATTTPPSRLMEGRRRTRSCSTSRSCSQVGIGRQEARTGRAVSDAPVVSWCGHDRVGVPYSHGEEAGFEEVPVVTAGGEGEPAHQHALCRPLAHRPRHVPPRLQGAVAVARRVQDGVLRAQDRQKVDGLDNQSTPRRSSVSVAELSPPIVHRRSHLPLILQ